MTLGMRKKERSVIYAAAAVDQLSPIARSKIYRMFATSIVYNAEGAHRDLQALDIVILLLCTMYLSQLSLHQLTLNWHHN